MNEPYEVGTHVVLIPANADGMISDHFVEPTGRYKYYVTTGEFDENTNLKIGYYCYAEHLILNLTKESFNPHDIETCRFVVLDMANVGQKWLGQFLGYSTSKISAVIQLIETAEVVFVPVAMLGEMMELVPRGEVNAVRKLTQKPKHTGKNGFVAPETIPE